jgi:predicted alpha-1,2-mannosidase
MPTRSPRPRARRRTLALGVVAAVIALTSTTDALAGSRHSAAPVSDPVSHVRPFVGTLNNPDATFVPFGKGYGNTFPGAAVPFGMVQFSPDTHNSALGGDTTRGNWGGYEYDADQIGGFSLTHLSGTGCEGSFGFHDVPFMPFTGALNTDGTLPASPATSPQTYRSTFRHDAEAASPGFYGVRLDNGAKVELTATQRTGVGKFAFPKGKPATLLVNASGSVNGTTASTVTIAGRTISGAATTTGTCGSGPYTVYFHATFDQPFTAHGTWLGEKVTAKSATATATDKAGAGAYVEFAPGARVIAHVGLSYTKPQNAAANLAAEHPNSDFATVRTAARRAWKDALGTIAITGGTPAQRQTFYTALYHSLLHPNIFDDANGEYLGMDNKVHRVRAGRHQYANFSGWDIYHDQVQLVTLLFPAVGADLGQSLVNNAVQSGRWYNWPHANVGVNIMNGDSLQSALASIYAFGGKDFDAKTGLKTMVDTQRLPGEKTVRGGLSEFVGAGYLPRGAANVWGPGATTLEYAIDDFGIGQLARRLGDKAAYAEFQQRAQNWQNLFNPATKSIHPRDRDGAFPAYNLDDDNNDQFVEGTGSQYTWLVPHNVRGLFDKMGGNDAAAAKLDTFFTKLNAGVHDGKYAWLTNEPTMHTPYLYNFAGKPAKTQATVRRALGELFSTEPNGLKGNDDLGALSSWYVWSAAGLYPAIPGRAELALTSPLFSEVAIRRHGTGKTLTISAPGAGKAPYIAALKVNGAPSTKTWLPESVVTAGGRVKMTMAGAPTSWGTGRADAPPSFTDGQHAFNNIGVSDDGKANTANLDSSGHSLSAQALAAAGVKPGGPVTAAGVTFTWPKTKPGKPNNWLVAGQTVSVPGGATGKTLSLLGLATNGPATGTLTVTYTDGSASTHPITFGDWAVATPQPGNVLAATMDRWNSTGGDSLKSYLFAAEPIALAAGKSVRSVTLPASTDKGSMHIFAIAAA